MKKLFSILILFITCITYAQDPALFPDGTQTSHVLAIPKTTAELNALGYGVNDRVLANDSTLDEWVRWNGTSWVSAFGSSVDLSGYVTNPMSANLDANGGWITNLPRVTASGNFLIDANTNFEVNSNSIIFNTGGFDGIFDFDGLTSTRTFTFPDQDIDFGNLAPLFTASGTNELASLPNYASAVGLSDGLLLEASGSKYYLAVGNLPFYSSSNFAAGTDYLTPSGNQTITAKWNYENYLAINTNWGLLLGDDGSGTQNSISALFADSSAGTIWRLYDNDLLIRDGSTTDRFTFERTTGNFTSTGNIIANAFIGDGSGLTGVGSSAPLQTTSTIIDLSNTTGNYGYASTATTADTFTLSNVTAGGKATYIIDTTGDTQFPTVTGSTQTNSAPFEAGVEFYMNVENNGFETEHYFIKKDIGNAFVLSDVLDLNGNSLISQSQTATGDGTTTIDWSLGNNFDFQFGATNETFTFTNPSKAGNFLLKLKQDATGSRTVTWPASVKWTGDGTAPTLNTGGSDIINFYFDGTDYFATNVLTYDAPAPVGEDFISRWVTTTASETVTLSIRTTDTYDVIVYWGDGASETITGVNQTFSHVYAAAGTYDITIEQNTPNGWKGLYFNNVGDTDKITDILQWGTSEITNLNFWGCSNLTGGTATDSPNLTALTSMASGFRSCSSLNITNWASWTPTAVTSYNGCFRDIQVNGGDASWITSATTNISAMYLNNDAFDQNWATADFSNLSNLSLFNSNGDGWSTANIDATLNGIASQAPSIQSGVTFDMGNGSRSAASDTSVTTLTGTYTWTINVN